MECGSSAAAFPRRPPRQPLLRVTSAPSALSFLLIFAPCLSIVIPLNAEDLLFSSVHGSRATEHGSPARAQPRSQGAGTFTEAMPAAVAA